MSAPSPTREDLWKQYDKSMKAFLALCALLSHPAHAAEPAMPRFYLDYAVVEHSLKNDKGYSKELLDFAKAHRQQADFLANFWWAKAKKECMETFKEIVHRYASQMTPSTSAANKTKLENLAKAESDQCVYGVIYDHWDEINAMIVERAKQADKEEAR